ncbi:hypothetical protein [Pseudonocardia sp. NPDC049635]|uniref:glycoside hydrolase family 19 protein n=1 Tax=Pseudonocardia sp. NPDC049635 TaxID=3155506 RepID=UPI0033D77158
MDVDTMVLAFRCSRTRAQRYAEAMNTAMLAASCTTVNRAAMWCAQVGHETLGLYYQEELADGSAYEGRKSLGNTQPGDGPRFKGRGWIQLTGRDNYTAFSRWCFTRGLVPAVDHIVRSPALVAEPPWSGLAAAWYWTVARPTINARADAADLDAVTRLINGGTNGLDDRRSRWEGALKLGARLLPAAPATTRPLPAPGRTWFDMATEEDLRRIIREETPPAVWHHPIPDWYQPDLPPQGAFAMLAWAAAHAAHARNNAAAVDALRNELRTALAGRPATARAAPADVEDLVDTVVEAIARRPLFLTDRASGG